MHNQYFQGILQLRNPIDANERNDADSHLNEVIRFIEKYRKFIQKKKKVNDGFDYYFISNNLLKRLAKKLKDNFGGIIKQSPRLYSRDRQTQKGIYRLNILFRLSDFQNGDIMKVDREIIRITSVKKKISGINIKKNKKISFLHKNIKEYSILPVINTRIVKVYPELYILDQDYQPVRVENKKKVRLNEKVKVVCCDGYWLV